MYEVVTSATPSYYQGVVALWNSIVINSPKCSLAVYCYDETEEYKRLEDLGIKVILNAEMLGPIIGKGTMRTCTGAPVNEDMYARLLIPTHFTGRAFYVDADCIILNPIYELWDDYDLEGHATACVWRPDIGWMGGHIYDDMASGTFLADCDEWNRRKLVEHCFEIMDDHENRRLKRRMPVNVESVLSYVHNGNFKKLDRIYQNLTYYGKLSQQDKVAHFASRKPWQPGGSNYKQLWRAYHDKDMATIELIESQLPPIKSKEVILPSDRGRLRAIQNKWSAG